MPFAVDLPHESADSAPDVRNERGQPETDPNDPGRAGVAVCERSSRRKARTSTGRARPRVPGALTAELSPVSLFRWASAGLS